MMMMKKWPNPCNKLVLNIHIEHECQANKQMDAAKRQQVWQGDIVVAPQPAQRYDRDDQVHCSSSTNIISLED
eukprot:3171749-Karenia_brevis.AAC.1